MSETCGKTFDPSAHMEVPFRQFLEAAEHCASKGYLVFMRPDDAQTSKGKWAQQLIILPASACLVTPTPSSNQEDL